MTLTYTDTYATIKKPSGLKYTDLCIYVDKHMNEFKKEPEERDQKTVETIYNYLWLVGNAIARKKAWFKNNFEYDEYALRLTDRVLKAIENSYYHAGMLNKKGKEIIPIKSCLNYMKAVMFPVKVEFLNSYYLTDMLGAAKRGKRYLKGFVSAQNAEKQKNLRELHMGVIDKHDYADAVNKINIEIDNVLKSIYIISYDAKLYSTIKNSVLLTLIQNIRANYYKKTKPKTALYWGNLSKDPELKMLVNNCVKRVLKHLKGIILDLISPIDEQFADKIASAEYFDQIDDEEY